ncbi:hypothetical protein J8273_6614 [Carpediemonas membranifera]|uniref:Uncharacterized protein n=1 Tax=Carpediemonas membranifera TaxID=201153 RepID=A0A8J6ARE0_9EUKA|nr:hypothetical protein J8273_6614 [Carpediemonas membranifera]|eukprot:KAG9392023.1 hypothetical protein J8273_6614 [Carpediemonas membranifera]
MMLPSGAIIDVNVMELASMSLGQERDIDAALKPVESARRANFPLLPTITKLQTGCQAARVGRTMPSVAFESELEEVNNLAACIEGSVRDADHGHYRINRYASDMVTVPNVEGGQTETPTTEEQKLQTVLSLLDKNLRKTALNKMRSAYTDTRMPAVSLEGDRVRAKFPEAVSVARDEFNNEFIRAAYNRGDAIIDAPGTSTRSDIGSTIVPEGLKGEMRKPIAETEEITDWGKNVNNYYQVGDVRDEEDDASDVGEFQEAKRIRQQQMDAMNPEDFLEYSDLGESDDDKVVSDENDEMADMTDKQKKGALTAFFPHIEEWIVLHNKLHEPTEGDESFTDEEKAIRHALGLHFAVFFSILATTDMDGRVELVSHPVVQKIRGLLKLARHFV